MKLFHNLDSGSFSMVAWEWLNSNFILQLRNENFLIQPSNSEMSEYASRSPI